jgi:hypothetical protein
MEFEWDEAKAAANKLKHGVGFRDAALVFDGPIIERPDDRRDYGERRLVALGVSAGLVLRVVFTRRAARIRIISAWRASSHEARSYRAIYPR